MAIISGTMLKICCVQAILICWLVAGAEAHAIPTTFAQDFRHENYWKLADPISPYWQDSNSSGTLLSELITKFKPLELVSLAQCLSERKRCRKENYRRIDGFCNTEKFPHFGSSHSPLSRLLKPVYDHGLMRMKAKNGGLLPNPRVISNIMKRMNKNILHNDVNIFWLFFGQFVDHDLVNTPKVRENSFSLDCTDCHSWRSHSACAPILIPVDDPSLPPLMNGQRRCLPFVRSSAKSSTYGVGGAAFEQINTNTAFLDLSAVYGSDACKEKRLRLYHFGQLIEMKSPIDGLGLPPLEDARPTRDCRSKNGKCPVTGDDRSIEIVGIMVFHVVFLREHNRLARRLHSLNKAWDDNRIYQEARKINIAQYQRIVFGDFLPLLIGPKLMMQYELNLVNTNEFFRGHDENINAQVLNEFASSAFRMGHTMIKDSILRMDKHYLPTGSFSLENIFRNTTHLYEAKLYEDVTRGMISSRIEAVDPVVQVSLTEKLFIKNSNPFTALDLVAINIARGRDHGLQSYTAYRKLCGLKTVYSFNHLDIHEIDKNLLSKVYSDVNDIDLFVGSLTEFPTDGSLLGPTFTCIIAEQFLRSRRGDSFWFENEGQFSIEQLQKIKEGSALRRIVMLNQEQSLVLPEDPFRVPDWKRNPLSSKTTDINLDPWKEPFSIPAGCHFQGKDFKSGEAVKVSPCLNCFCVINELSCSRRGTEACRQNFDDESCNLLCGLP